VDRSLRQKSVLPDMDHDMSQKTRKEVLSKLRRQYAKAGPDFKRQLLDQAVRLLGYHRKSAIRALRAQPPPVRAPAVLCGRPRDYEPARLLPVLKPIWFAALQPCGSRLAALLPEWLPAYEQDHRRLDPDLRASLLQVSGRTLDRLLAPLRVTLSHGRGPARRALVLSAVGSLGRERPSGVHAGWAAAAGLHRQRQRHLFRGG
jgi:hypothetical protein